MRHLVPFLDLRDLNAQQLPGEFLAAAAVVFLAVPQGVAYALIAGLPPAMGLYAATFPTIIGSFFRSSRQVVAGPTNALSLLVGGAIIGTVLEPDAAAVAVTLAFLVGVMQVLAGALRLGSVVDYISSPVVLGYITGAGVLIGVGQLHNVTGTEGPRGNLFVTIAGWIETLASGVDALTVGVAAATVVLVLVLRRIDRRIPSAVIAMVASILAATALGLEDRGLQTIGDIAPIPAGLPPLSLPDPTLFQKLLPVAVACTVLSLVESSAVGRSIAGRTGQKLDASTEFFGQGVANLAAAFFSGYPTSGSLTRSALNEQVGAKTRLSGSISGVFMLVVLLILGPTMNHTPIAALAGLLLIVAWDLVRPARIQKVVRTRFADRVAFVVTVLGTWSLTLDKAIYLGVGISLVLFLRRARLLVIREMAFSPENRMRDVALGRVPEGFRRCKQVRILHVEGALFFGSAGELRAAIEEAASAPGVREIIVRLKRTQGLDVTTIETLEAIHQAMEERGQHLSLVGLRPGAMETMRRSGAVERLQCYPSQPLWFAAMDAALTDTLSRLDRHEVDCPLEAYVADRTALKRKTQK
ncbi:MAG: SulP family inorganic anion transporter [Myxococcota bacterium]